MKNGLAVTANLLGEPARAAILLELMSGRALPAGELALAANISPQTASGHLAKLIDGNLLNVESQGRHRYYRLSGTEVADAVEALLALTTGARRNATRDAVMPVAGTLAYARTCYAHLAGWLGVQIADALQTEGLLQPASNKTFTITHSGVAWLQDLGIATTWTDKTSGGVAKECLDWSERRPHLAGSVGVAMYKRFLALEWIVHLPKTRAVRVTITGKRELWKRLRLAVG